MIYNTIEDQKLTHANQLTIHAWNRIINILKTQANNNSQEIERLINWLGFRDVKSFQNYITAQLEELRDELDDKMDERTILERVVSDSDALVTSKGIYDAIPRIRFEKHGDFLHNINHNDTDYPLPISTFTITTKDGFMSEYKIGDDDPYKVFTPDAIPKTGTVANDDTLITSKGVYNEFNKYKQITEYTQDNGNLTGINFNDGPVSVPSTPFTLFFSTPSDADIIYGFQIENDKYKFASGSNISVDPNVTEDSPNPVESRGIYRALEEKVDKDDYEDILGTIDNLKTIANNALNIAQGRADSYVFKTFEDMVQNLNTNKTYNIGNNLYIEDTEVPDYWITSKFNEIDNDEGVGRYGYYTIIELESKNDLINYPTIDDVNDAISDAITKAITKVLTEDV